jgi:adenylosuccinate lyase
MTNPHDTYTSPLASRNASPEMCAIWSPRHKFTTWRKIWLAVAEAQQACGLDITDEQLGEMRSALDVTDEDMEAAATYERELRHDVMAHVHAWGDRCPKARSIIHLGCTSQDVVCNADLICMYEATNLMLQKLERAVCSLGIEAEKWANLPTLGFTHYQPAQPTTVGRRLANWGYDLIINSYSIYEDIGDKPKLRGFRGATGTQASFLQLFGNEEKKVERFESLAVWNLLRSCGYEEGDFDDMMSMMERASKPFNELTNALSQSMMDEVADEIGAESPELSESDGYSFTWSESSYLDMNTFRLTGQTYPRVYDAQRLSALANIASVLHKIATDIRLLSNRKEIDEPFGKSQIGSSAMPYKRNPMKCERICGLTRFVMNLVGNAYDTAATQWLERTLDDSSNRRLSLPEAFLALDGALDLMHTVASGLIVNEAMVKRNLMAELPFMATENIMMEAVKLGRDRQDVHEAIRVLSHEAGYAVKQEGRDNDLLDRLKSEPLLEGVDIDAHLDPMQYVGRSVEQTERFIKDVVEPLRERYRDQLDSLGSADRGV